jgi:hypothetical protein
MLSNESRKSPLSSFEISYDKERHSNGKETRNGFSMMALGEMRAPRKEE